MFYLSIFEPPLKALQQTQVSEKTRPNLNFCWSCSSVPNQQLFSEEEQPKQITIAIAHYFIMKV